jgi:hypothetical protein
MLYLSTMPVHRFAYSAASATSICRASSSSLLLVGRRRAHSHTVRAATAAAAPPRPTTRAVLSGPTSFRAFAPLAVRLYSSVKSRPLAMAVQTINVRDEGNLRATDWRCMCAYCTDTSFWWCFSQGCCCFFIIVAFPRRLDHRGDGCFLGGPGGPGRQARRRLSARRD